MPKTTRDEELPRFAIFRERDARFYSEVPVMYAEAMSPTVAENWPKLQEAGYDGGHEVKLLFSAPGFSLTHVWFKSGFPLPRHSHNADCLYYVVAGTLRIGSEELGPGDGFFIGEDAPYTYTPGEGGVEVLEFRTSDRFNIKFLADNPAFWRTAVEQVRSRSETWASEVRPASALRSGGTAS
ncbi:MAG: cupin domain-containing protein [Rhizomicrobium sp.]